MTNNQIFEMENLDKDQARKKWQDMLAMKLKID